MKKIVINTSSNKEISIVLLYESGKDEITHTMNHKRAQVVLTIIASLLEKHNLTVHDLTEVEVATGPGSFTGLRVGVAISNTLGHFLNISVNGKEIGELVTPKYE